MEKEFSTLDLKIFFDESGKSGNQNQRPHLMAGISIPAKIYDSTNIQELNEVIQSKLIHWTKYNGDGNTRKAITKIILTIASFHQLTKINVISYNQAKIEDISKNIKNVFENIVDQTIYMKFPERIIYGLLRKYGEHVHVNSEIFIEHDTTYENKKYDLRNQLFQQLNIQSVYRGEHFLIRDADYLPKQKEVGIEIIDLIIGMVRSIIRNDSPNSRGIREKNKLIINLLNDSNFYNMLKNISYYEWASSSELVEIKFDNYLQNFIIANTEL